MTKLNNFIDTILKDRKKFTNASDGNGFEEIIKSTFKNCGISEIVKAHDPTLKKYLQDIKPTILSKTGSTLIDNTLYKDTQNQMYKDFFCWQPYGSQEFPDFLAFTEHKIFSIETKYSSENNKKPMWNGNLPKMDGIYIFGSYGKKDLTFFRGEDILPEIERQFLISAWDEACKVLEKYEAIYKRKIDEGIFFNEYGFTNYLRKAYEQKQTINSEAITNFLTNPNRDKLEKALCKFVKENDK